MSKNTRIFAMILLVLGGVTYWFEVGPGSRTSMEMEPRATVGGDGFEVAVPDGFLFVTDDRMQVPDGGVALAKPANDADEEQTSTVIIVPVAPRTPPFDPTSEEACATMGEQLSSGGKININLTGTGLMDAPFGRTCEIKLAQGEAIVGRMVVAYKGARQWSITCRLDKNDAAAAAGCQQIIDGLRLR